VNGNQNFSDDLIAGGGPGGGWLISSVDLGIFMPTDPTYLSDPLGPCALILAGGSQGGVGGVCGNNTLVKGRISWREIIGD
jgi:hypothetical protein